jgi:hypothetical protein
MRLINIRSIKLAVVLCVASLVTTAETLPYWHRIALDMPEFARPPRIFRGIEIWERIQQRRGPVRPTEHGPHRFVESECPETAPASAATPEPGYEWALGLFLVAIGCASRIRKK